MNLCRSCQQNFGSVSAFDTHRTGTHEYLLSEGLRMDPPREDGRRCLSVREMENSTHKNGTPVFSRNKSGAWSLTKKLEAARAIRKEEE